MKNWLDEIELATHGQERPLPFYECMGGGCFGGPEHRQVLVNVSVNKTAADLWLKDAVAHFGEHVTKFSKSGATLVTGQQIWSLSRHEVEMGRLRGVTPVWVY